MPAIVVSFFINESEKERIKVLSISISVFFMRKGTTTGFAEEPRFISIFMVFSSPVTMY